MASLSTPGVGSGIDIGGIIDKLMTIEKQPLQTINTEIVTLQSQVSAYGSLKSAVSTFRDAVAGLADVSKFKTFAATSSDATVLGTTASSSAAKGVYNIQVLRIAENHRMAANTTYADTGSTVVAPANSSMTIQVGGKGFTVDISNQTLAQVRDSINQASANTGVTASILKDDVGYRLSLSANNTGSANALSVSYSGADPFALQTLNQSRITGATSFTPASLDAQLKLENNFTITSSSNSVTDAIQGVSLNLLAAGTTTVKVDRDSSAVQNSIQSLVKAYSDLVGTMTKMKSDVLQSDPSLLVSIESQMRSVLGSNTDVGGSYTNAFQIGISTQKDGSLTLNTTTLSGAVNDNFDSLAKLFADPDKGLAVRLRNMADSLLASGGPLDGRSQGLNSQIHQTEAQKARLEQRLQITQDRLTKQYNSLDGVVTSMKSTGDLLIQQLTALTNSMKA